MKRKHIRVRCPCLVLPTKSITFSIWVFFYYSFVEKMRTELNIHYCTDFAQEETVFNLRKSQTAINKSFVCETLFAVQSTSFHVHAVFGAYSKLTGAWLSPVVGRMAVLHGNRLGPVKLMPRPRPVCTEMRHVPSACYKICSRCRDVVHNMFVTTNLLGMKLQYVSFPPLGCHCSCIM